MFKRKISNEINKWKDSLKIKRRALVIKGLRQIGKTTVVKYYCESNCKSVIYINFMDNKSIKKIFDTRTEKRIQDAMVRLMANRTSIIIAHRLSTIQDADLIVVLDNGVVVESCNHNELLEKNGVYKKLYETQFKGLNT